MQAKLAAEELLLWVFEIKAPAAAVPEPAAPHLGHRAIIEEISRDTLISVDASG
jgi:hypothetical protein